MDEVLAGRGGGGGYQGMNATGNVEFNPTAVFMIAIIESKTERSQFQSN